MPSKYYNGQNPLGGKRIKGGNLDSSSGFAQVELAVSRLQPATTLQSGSLQTPSGRILTTRRQRVNTSTRCIPWKPRIVDERAEGAENPDYKLYLNPGTINGLISANWNDPVSLPVNYALNVYYIIATTTLTDGQVNSIAYSAVTTIPSGSELDPINQDSLPTNHKTILGVIDLGSVCMLYASNLRLLPFKALQEPNPSAAVGELPYKLFWSLKIETAS